MEQPDDGSPRTRERMEQAEERLLQRLCGRFTGGEGSARVSEEELNAATLELEGT